MFAKSERIRCKIIISETKRLFINDVTTYLIFSDPAPYKSDVTNLPRLDLKIGEYLVQVYIYVFNKYCVHILHTCL